MTPPVPRHIVVSRTDKVGDLLLSLPVFQTLRKAFPEARITALVSSYAKEIVQGHPAIDEVVLVERDDFFWITAQKLRFLKADTFIALYPRPRLALAAWLASIPTRIGTAFRWYSFLFNQKVRVHRHFGERHEVEFNLDLVKPLGVTRFADKIEFPLSPTDRDFAKDLLNEKGVSPGTRYVAVHPGHKGSALNWSPQRYSEIVAKFCQQKNLRVILTAGPDETPLISQVTAFLSAHSLEQKPVLLIGECTLKQLAAIYAGADCFLSGSTGTLHLAAAVGTPTVALFCPIPETTPVRWGPWGNEATVLMPSNPQCTDCQKGFCQKHDPMDAIGVDEVFQAMEKYIHSKDSR